MTVVTMSHIVIDDTGVARIAGSRSRVIDVVLDQQAYGMTPEQMHQEHPHLSMAQIHAALAYYYDHKAEIDAEIERQLRTAESITGDVIEVRRHSSIWATSHRTRWPSWL